MATQRRTLVLACLLSAVTLDAAAQSTVPTERASSSTQSASTQSSASTQGTAQSSTFAKEEIAQLVAPVALYPDSLLAQVLMASTYPGEVADAAKWVKAHPEVKGDDAVKAVAKEDWDASVQALVAFPQAVAMMGSDIAWVQKLGDAFLAQPNDVMAMAQELRRKAQAAGNLKSNEYQKVSTEPEQVPGTSQQTIVIESTNPQTVYVPAYNPTVVYGTWGYPGYMPYYYPPPAYYYPGYAVGAGIAWGIGIGIAWSNWGNCNWGGGDVNINSSRYNEFNRNIDRGDRQMGERGNQRFQHDGSRRDGVPYRDQASREKYGNRQAGAEGRERFRGDDPGRAQSRDQARQQMERQGFQPARDNAQARDRAQSASRDPRASQVGGGGVDRGPGGQYRQSGQNNAASRDLARSSGGRGDYGNSRNNAFSGAGIPVRRGRRPTARGRARTCRAAVAPGVR